MRLGGFMIAAENCGKVALRNQPCRAHSVAQAEKASRKPLDATTKAPFNSFAKN